MRIAECGVQISALLNSAFIIPNIPHYNNRLCQELLVVVFAQHQRMQRCLRSAQFVSVSSAKNVPIAHSDAGSVTGIVRSFSSSAATMKIKF
jgi:hypothetical protein